MRSAHRRFINRAATIRPVTIHAGADRRGGFTLIEMMVSVTLVLLMMLMFAEIYGMAQEMISKQKGIAENDQKARILTEVLRQDLEARTFRDVYPFKTEMTLDITTAPPNVLAVPTLPVPGQEAQSLELLSKRQGYLAFSENDPNDDTDDTLSLTVDVGHPKHGTPGRRLFGKATATPATPPPAGLVNGPQDGPDYDDGRLNDASGASPMAEVSYFLRYGNLYRSTLLIRKPYLEGDDRKVPPLTGTQGATTPDGFPGSPSTTAYPAGRVFWEDFDYSALRETDASVRAGLTFHGARSLSNDPEDNPSAPYDGTVVGPLLFLPRSLGAPQLRFGHMVTLEGQPLEFLNTPTSSYFADVVADAGDWATWKADTHGFFGRFTTLERSDGNMTFPGTDLGPFATGVASGDSDGNGLIDFYQDGGRRGVDLMLPNVHGFDIQVWDDIERDYVNLGHSRPADNVNPYTLATDQPGFYHISRLRRAYEPATAPAPSDNFRMEHSALPDDYDFGNRYDTWSPNMYIPSAAGTQISVGIVYPLNTTFSRIGRAPYRPLQSNPDPNANKTIFNRIEEPAVLFGDKTLDDDGNGIFYPAQPFHLTDSNDAEAPLRAIRIIVRYLDPQSGQTRQVTLEQSLIE